MAAGAVVEEIPPAETGPVARYLLPDNASIGSDGSLAIGGVSAEELAERFGTPLFVYDEDHLAARCRATYEAFGEGAAYATKAFLCKAMARVAAGEGLRLDVSSAGEMYLALAAGVSPAKLVLHGSNKSEEELELALSAGVGRIVVDSFDELARLGELARRPRTMGGGGAGHGGGTRAAAPGCQGGKRGGDRSGHRLQPVMLRVNPGIEAHTHEYVRTGQADSKFGFSAEGGGAIRAAEMVAATSGLALAGLHAHIGSQIFDVEHFEEEVEVLADLAAAIHAPTERDRGRPRGADAGLEPFEVCIGGGLGVAYLSSERAPTIAEWASVVIAAAARHGLAGMANVTAEPGRAIVATAGMTIYKIGTIKEIPGIRTYISVDGGMSDNPRPVLYGSGYEAFLAGQAASPRPFAARVVGKHCESGDIVVENARLPDNVSVGDLLVTPVTGAYGYSMASNYNKVPRPAVVFVSSGEARVVVERESLEDMTRLDRD